MVTKESVESKLKALREQLTQLQANANATQGAIMLCEQLLSEATDTSPDPTKLVV